MSDDGTRISFRLDPEIAALLGEDMLAGMAGQPVSINVGDRPVDGRIESIQLSQAGPRVTLSFTDPALARAVSGQLNVSVRDDQPRRA